MNITPPVLSPRLAEAARLVGKCNCFADIGTDHAYLPIYLLMTGACRTAVASDIGEGPLKRASAAAQKYNQTVSLRLGSGLSTLERDEADAVVIAGMGGPLMEKILTEGKTALPGFRELILQPQSDIPHFRHFLMEHGFCIIQEEMILEDGKYYPMMKAVSGRTPGEIWTREEEMFGKLLLERLHPVLYKYLQRELQIREEISGQLKNAAGEGAKKRLDEVEEEKRLILAALQRYEGKGTDRLA